MKEAKAERRSGARVVTRVPVSVRSSKDGLATEGFTRDLTTSGVFFYTDLKIKEGSQLEIVLMLPAELTDGKKSWVCCHADVVRVENPGEANGFGVAASIRDMQVLPEIMP